MMIEKIDLHSLHLSVHRFFKRKQSLHVEAEGLCSLRNKKITCHTEEYC